jgi:hypothetical protein
MLEAAGFRIIVPFMVVALVGLDLIFRRHRGGLRRGVFIAVLSASAQRDKRGADQNGGDTCKPAQTEPHANSPIIARFPGADGVSILRPSL